LAISRKKKEQLVQQYSEQLAGVQGFILADYRGLRVAQMEQLRRSVRTTGSRFHVVKNRLLKFALQEGNRAVPDEWLKGPTAVAFCTGELAPVAKVLSDFAKDVPALVIKGALLGSSVLSADKVATLAELPTLDVLLAQVLGTINTPATQAAGVVAGGIRQVLNVLQAYVDKLEGSTRAPQAA
jgi:large subunit ribosomal protein L10